MVSPNFNVSDAFLNSPKSDKDESSTSVDNSQKFFAQNANKIQNNLAYFWSSGNVELNTDSQDDLAISVANYVFENILEDQSTTINHNDSTDLYIIDRIDYSKNTKNFGNEQHKGFFMFMPSFSNNSNDVSLQQKDKAILKLYKYDASNNLIALNKGELIPGKFYLIAYNYKLDVPCYVLFDIINSDTIKSKVGKYTVDKRMDLVNNVNDNPELGQIILNIQDGNLSKDKVDSERTDVYANSIYTVYKIDSFGVIYYKEIKLKPGDIIFVKQEYIFLYYNGISSETLNSNSVYLDGSNANFNNLSATAKDNIIKASFGAIQYNDMTKIGAVFFQDKGTNGTATLPDGGSWLVYYTIRTLSGILEQSYSLIRAGGSVLGQSNRVISIFALRIQ